MDKNIMDFKQLTNCENHNKLFNNKNRYVLVLGSAGAGKSYSVTDHIILQAILYKQFVKSPKPLKILALRKTRQSLSKTVLQLFENRLNLFGIKYNLNLTSLTMDIPLLNTKIYFMSMNDKASYEKIKSFTDVSIIWVEEANEITEEGFQVLKLRLRGGEHPYPQIIMSLNPVACWIKNYFIDENNEEDLNVCKYTIEENKFADEKFILELRRLKDINKSLYEIYYLGNWSKPEGNIFTNIEAIDINQVLFKHKFNMKIKDFFDEYLIGIDFGYKDPSVAAFIGVKDSKFYIFDEIYETELTNDMFISRVNAMITKHGLDKRKMKLYADSAEPDRIELFYRDGFNITPAKKDVLDGINSVLTSNVYISGCDKINKDIRLYSWNTNTEGRYIDSPNHYASHGPDAIRYCIFTHTYKQKNKPKIYMV